MTKMKSRTQEPSVQSLLEFMDIASDAVKSALKKPTTFKRHINHRRYLQRQVKSVVRNRQHPRKVNPCDLREDVQELVREAIKELKHSPCYANALGASFGHMRSHHELMTNRRLSQQIQTHFQSSRPTHPTYRLTHPSQPITYQTHIHRANKENSSTVSADFCYHNEANLTTTNECLGLSSLTDECFMSGEELTNNIDINDLYIPELHEPRSPVVKCEDYIFENDLEIPSPIYGEESIMRFKFDHNLGNLDQFL
ncbi:uncharacterized protein LOC114536031 [Dendronephthya gigantea]|uniref:uncharacterized protein LOC114536031 n=1 Tax=Dendronephthya gigantea TaxID=151771 RepID=UPI001069132C|nr:uncharacterized protein LOC114536031 [Dendronephthya gigantea]